VTPTRYDMRNCTMPSLNRGAAASHPTRRMPNHGKTAPRRPHISAAKVGHDFCRDGGQVWSAKLRIPPRWRTIFQAVQIRGAGSIRQRCIAIHPPQEQGGLSQGIPIPIALAATVLFWL